MNTIEKCISEKILLLGMKLKAVRAEMGTQPITDPSNLLRINEIRLEAKIDVLKTVMLEYYDLRIDEAKKEKNDISIMIENIL